MEAVRQSFHLAGLNALQATYLRDQRPIPLPTIEKSGESDEAAGL